MPRKCSLCHQPGHRKDRCPTAGGQPAKSFAANAGAGREVISGIEMLVERKLLSYDANLTEKINDLVDAKLQALAEALAAAAKG